jgi:redox-sensitive bicupin YhaK (pirin superfamily)
MSGDLVLFTRTRDLGSFSVRRALPSAQRRTVGPFIFFDHFGPVVMPPGQGMDVRPHPHINLATVTYLFDGELIHRDSLGYHQAIVPGELNWMTAGRGIVHSERSSVEARKQGGVLAHGIQAWVALPQSHEEDEPSFQHHDGGALPMVERGGAKLRVIAGSAYGASSPAIVHSPLFYVEASFESGGEIALPDEYAERAAYVVEGTMQTRAGRIEEGCMLLFGAGPAMVSTDSRCRVMLLGGAPLDSERHLWWNFASSSLERIERAKRDWKEGRFPKVPGDEQEFIPLPES